MDKTSIKKLKEEVFLRSALISVGYLDDIFALNESFSADQILSALIKKALRAFEVHHPLVWESKLYIDQLCKCETPGPGYFKIESNFDAYKKCILSEDQIILVPNAMPKIRLVNSYPVPGAYWLPADYQRPYIHFGITPPSQMFYMRGVCSRPLDIELDKTTKEFTDDSYIYWMNIDEGLLGEKFVLQVLCEILEYIKSLKGMLSLPNMPVDLFGSVETQWMNLKQELDQYYLQSAWRGDLLV